MSGKTTYSHARGVWIDPNTGEELEQLQLMRQMAEKQVILLGETHNVAEIHRWQLHVAAFLHAHRPRIAMGFEMFPRRLQPVLDAWVGGQLETQAFLEKAEWQTVWGFPPELYLPLFHFCRQQKIPMLALNCYRELVTRVGREGWEAIPEEERDGLTPSAPATDAYRNYLTGLMTANGRTPAMGVDGGISDRFLRAQQTWDRAFACNIAHALAAPGFASDPPLIIGIIGRGHLVYGHGTPHQLRDLGINDIAVLLPTESGTHDAQSIAGIGDAIFRIDVPEPHVEMAQRRQKPESGTREAT